MDSKVETDSSDDSRSASLPLHTSAEFSLRSNLPTMFADSVLMSVLYLLSSSSEMSMTRT